MTAPSTTFWYGRVDPGYVNRYELTVEGRYDLADKFDLASLAKRAADDYHSNHDGWEASWPISFAITTSEDGDELARFEIERDVEPVFYVRRIGTAGEAP